MESLQVKYKINLIDARDYNLHLLFKNRMTWILAIGTPLIVFFLLRQTASFWLTITICALSYVLAIVLNIGYVFWCVESSWENTEQEEVVLSTNNIGLQFLQKDIQSDANWNAVRSVEKSSKFIFIKFKNGNLTAIPIRAFVFRNSAEEFFEFILKNTKNNTV